MTELTPQERAQIKKECYEGQALGLADAMVLRREDFKAGARFGQTERWDDAYALIEETLRRFGNGEPVGYLDWDKAWRASILIEEPEDTDHFLNLVARCLKSWREES